MCGFFPFSSLSCSQPCLQLHFGAASLHVGNGELPLRSCPRTTAPGAARSWHLSRMWHRCCGSGWWSCGTGSGLCRGGSCWQAQVPSCGEQSQQGLGKKLMSLGWLGTHPHTCPAPPWTCGRWLSFPTCALLLEHHLPFALGGIVAGDLLHSAVGKIWDEACRVQEGQCLLVQWSQSCYCFSLIFCFLDNTLFSNTFISILRACMCLVASALEVGQAAHPGWFLGVLGVKPPLQQGLLQVFSVCFGLLLWLLMDCNHCHTAKVKLCVASQIWSLSLFFFLVWMGFFVVKDSWRVQKLDQC